MSEDEVKKAETFAQVGQTVDYTLPENESVGGQSTFEATVTRVYDDGETVDLEFLPPGAESEKVLRTMVPYGPGTGAWFVKDVEEPAQGGDGGDGGDGDDGADAGTGEGAGADGAGEGSGGWHLSGTGALEAGDAAAAAVATHPRVTLDSLLAKIKDTRYYCDDVLTIAVVETVNGFKFVGHSAPASPQNFNPELGRSLARENAIRQMWTHEGYLLCEKLAFGENKLRGMEEH